MDHQQKQEDKEVRINKLKDWFNGGEDLSNWYVPFLNFNIKLLRKVNSNKLSQVFAC